MRKIVVFILFFLMVFTSTVVSCEESELPTIIGGNGKDQAVSILPGTIAKSSINGSGHDFSRWFRIESNTDVETIYYLNVSALYITHNNEIEVYVYDRNDKELAHEKVQIGENKTITLTIKPYDYANIRVREGWYSDFEFSLCDASTHKVGQYKEITTDPTCTETGVLSEFCELCHVAVPVDTVPATGHIFSAPILTEEANCMHVGHQIIKCTICEEILTEIELPMQSHVYDQMTIVSPATCTDGGYAEQRCVNCNTLINSEELPALGHTPGSVETTTSTCLVEGKKVVHCSVCNEVLSSEAIAKSGHVPDTWVDLRKATCTAAGQRVQNCAVCNVTLATETVTAFGHSPLDWQITREAACLQSGLREKKCSDCGLTLESEQINALGHTYTEWETITEATKEQEGEKRRHCINCGDTQFEKIEKLPKVLGIF